MKPHTIDGNRGQQLDRDLEHLFHLAAWRTRRRTPPPPAPAARPSPSPAPSPRRCRPAGPGCRSAASRRPGSSRSLVKNSPRFKPPNRIGAPSRNTKKKMPNTKKIALQPHSRISALDRPARAAGEQRQRRQRRGRHAARGVGRHGEARLACRGRRRRVGMNRLLSSPDRTVAAGGAARHRHVALLFDDLLPFGRLDPFDEFLHGARSARRACRDSSGREIG